MSRSEFPRDILDRKAKPNSATKLYGSTLLLDFDSACRKRREILDSDVWRKKNSASRA
jgi:hypothetical protein